LNDQIIENLFRN